MKFVAQTPLCKSRYFIRFALHWRHGRTKFKKERNVLHTNAEILLLVNELTADYVSSTSGVVYWCKKLTSISKENTLLVTKLDSDGWKKLRYLQYLHGYNFITFLCRLASLNWLEGCLHLKLNSLSLLLVAAIQEHTSPSIVCNHDKLHTQAGNAIVK